MNSLLAAGEDKLNQAYVSGDKGGEESKRRSGKNCWVPHDYDDNTKSLAEKISRLVDIPLENAESFQIIYYGKTQEYAPHFDAWKLESERGKRCMKRGGQRLVTCLLYLNTVPEGGGTCFPKLGIEVPAVRGNMVVFHNCLAGSTQRHEKSLHGGTPVILGEKWACNLWFREKSYLNAA